MKLTLLSTTSGNNLNLANSINSIANDLGYFTEIISLESYNLPLYNPATEKSGIPEGAKELSLKLENSEAFIMLAPEYNGSIPPVLINTISWISRSGDNWRQAFNGKIAVVGTHSGGGGFKVTQAMRTQLEHLGTMVHPRPIITNKGKTMNPNSVKAILEEVKGFLK
ncbi:MAG: NAD(P)H-dependent oxidoreductase [Bacteriovoracaceae bacterium]|jgi:chromate reductase, NAD(P)H dehydrogenase (quinone)|nr:NAD(P)H-dependent oxidoreductase [Bacteriovoracaceae bacterium]